MQGFSRKEKLVIASQPMFWVILVLLLLNLFLAVINGCQNAQDSGSTVTGRSSAFPGNQPVAFMRVLLDGKSEDRVQVTDSTGTFTMYHVPKGEYKITFARFGINIFTKNLVIDQEDQTYIVDIPEVQAGIAELSGKISDSEGEITGAEVWLIYPDAGVVHAVTGGDGRYSLSNLPDGLAHVVITASGRKTKTLSNVKIGFEGTRDLSVELEKDPKINTGRITGFVKDKDGLVLKDAFIGAFPTNVVPSIYANTSEEVLTSLAGYAIEVPEGQYVLICLKSGFVPVYKAIHVAVGGDYIVDFKLTTEEDQWRRTGYYGSEP